MADAQELRAFTTFDIPRPSARIGLEDAACIELSVR